MARLFFDFALDKKWRMERSFVMIFFGKMRLFGWGYGKIWDGPNYMAFIVFGDLMARL